MANYPKKMTDPTEAALSAIQEALNIRDDDAAGGSRPDGMADLLSARAAAASRRVTQSPTIPTPSARATSRHRPPRAANDDQQSIGQILHALQRRPARSSYFCRHGVFLRLDCRLSCFVLGLSFGPQCRARSGPLARRSHDRSRRGRTVADHLLLRRRPHGLARPGIAPDRPIDGAGRHAACRARKRGARFHRHCRTGHPPRSRGHGRRRRAGAGARQRT